MKKTLITLTLTSISSLSWGVRIQDRIHSIDLGKKNEEHLLKLESGRVAFIDSKRPPYYRPSDFSEGALVELELDKRLTIKSMTSLLPTDVSLPSDDTQEISESEGPTILPDYETAKKIFDGMNRSYKKNTECSDRAHVWAYEEWKKNDLYSNKIFLFFTNTYIRDYRFRWWFHVAPYTLVHERGETVEHILDRKYTNYPYHTKQWSDVFIRSKRACPVSTYAHYRANKYGNEHCFLVKTSMYYRLPLQVRRMEDQGTIKAEFSKSEVNFSYRAFKKKPNL